MSERDLAPWQTSLLLAMAVIGAVVGAMFLSQLDTLQRRSLLPPRRLPVIAVQATIEASELEVVVLSGEASDTELAENGPTPAALPTATPQGTEATILEPSCPAALSSWEPYIVQPSDTLSSLAVSYGLGAHAIARANCLGHTQLLPGQVLLLPPRAASLGSAQACGAPAGWQQYVVQQGDSIFRLARQYETTVLSLKEANCLESTYLVAGRKLFVPPAAGETQLGPTVLDPSRPGRPWPKQMSPTPEQTADTRLD